MAETRPPRYRREALTRAQIADAALMILDQGGTDALTVRALTERLQTGAGAIYHHVGSMGDLIRDATTSTVLAALPPADYGEMAQSSREAIHAIAIRLMAATEQHPWLAGQLIEHITRDPGGSLTPHIFESIGRHLETLGVPEPDWFLTVTTIVHYILGALSQNSPPNETPPPDTDAVRDGFLSDTAAAWARYDPASYPFLRRITGQMRHHDDRDQLLAGIDLILNGASLLRPRGSRS